MDTELDLDTAPRPTWLERLRAIPRGVWGFMVLLLLLLTSLLVRTWFLSQVPDIGDPFDVAAFCKSMEVPPEDDALTLYRKAGSLYAQELWERFHGPDRTTGYWGLDKQTIDPVLTQGWGLAGDYVKERVAAHEASLREWKQATEMDRVGFDSSETLLLRGYKHGGLEMVGYLESLASLRGRRCEAEQNFAGAFQWYRAWMRSRLRFLEGQYLSEREQELNDIVRWAALPEVTSAQLRAAASQLRRVRASFRPASDALKAEYVRAMNSFRDRDGLATTIRYRSGQQSPMDERTAAFWRSAYWVVGEPERTRRIYQHLVANQLRAIDLPGSTRRARYFMSSTLMYLDDAAVPLPSGHLPVGRLAAVIHNSAISDKLVYSAKGGAFLLRNGLDDLFLQESRAFRVLLDLLLALQAHQRDHGAFPAKLEDLVPNYIDAVPVDPCDPAALNVRYRLDLSDQATVWSVGTNGTDENGFRHFVTGDAVLVVRAPENAGDGPSPESAKD